MKVTYNDSDLQKNQVTRAEVDEVVTSACLIECRMPPSKDGNDRIMLVGFTSTARLLEVGIEFLADQLHIFHASQATRPYRDEYEKQVRV